LADRLDIDINKETLQTAHTHGNAANAAEGENVELLGENTAAWEKAKASLKESLNEEAFTLWIEPMKALVINGKLTLDCPDPYFLAYVERHFKAQIRDVLQLQGLGIDDVFLSSGESQKAIQREKEERQRLRREAAEQDENARLAALTPGKQFFELWAAYHEKRRNTFFAGIRFFSLRKLGKLPDTAALLRRINQLKATPQWQENDGRYLPGLQNWLQKVADGEA